MISPALWVTVLHIPSIVPLGCGKSFCAHWISETGAVYSWPVKPFRTVSAMKAWPVLTRRQYDNNECLFYDYNGLRMKSKNKRLNCQQWLDKIYHHQLHQLKLYQSLQML